MFMKNTDAVQTNDGASRLLESTYTVLHGYWNGSKYR
jgi:hypothetical protein